LQDDVEQGLRNAGPGCRRREYRPPEEASPPGDDQGRVVRGRLPPASTLGLADPGRRQSCGC
jgi:hypothetical protein